MAIVIPTEGILPEGDAKLYEALEAAVQLLKDHDWLPYTSVEGSPVNPYRDPVNPESGLSPTEERYDQNRRFWGIKLPTDEQAKDIIAWL